ncbi:MAG: GTP cyclohydrolase MptA [Candidatus Baldrarchaeia archaeon]
MTNDVDVQAELPKIPLRLDKVGVYGMFRQLKILHGKEVSVISVKIDAFIDMPPSMRGIHMSRSADAIEEIVERATFKPYTSVEEFCLEATNLLLRYHEYASVAEVRIRGITVIPYRSKITQGSMMRPIRIWSRVLNTRKGDPKVLTGISTYGLLVCPCGQLQVKKFVKNLLKKRIDEIGLSEETLEKILNIIPIASHNQRAKVSVEIDRRYNGKNIDWRDLLRIIDESVSSQIEDVLKRNDEEVIIRLGHLNPMFVEDCARSVLLHIIKEFDWLPEDSRIRVIVRSYESIHNFDVVAKRTSKVGELRREVKNLENIDH